VYVCGVEDARKVMRSGSIFNTCQSEIGGMVAPVDIFRKYDFEGEH